ncbi:hypothetical protein [Jiangella rhizosphaerae]|uniref:Argininosuccinate synthase n=1 Tax=Jiangella rhizosphaerae TaxID=2293569 RepID=A0A418KIB9_9ACTN|nr:hypothetical protein [Jiangella rhizosphaerae]RIQ12941.1 hypothetical protein DY240_26455 [Jiangella rhizosphaerae]
MTVTFDDGRPVALDGETVTLAEALLLTGQLARAHGLVGPGGSVLAAGAAVLEAARRELAGASGTVRLPLAEQERRAA